MKFIFNRDYVASNNKGFVAGQELPEEVLTDEQIARLVESGMLKQVFDVNDVFVSKQVVAVLEDEEDEVDPVQDPIEALNPERKVKGRNK